MSDKGGPAHLKILGNCHEKNQLPTEIGLTGQKEHFWGNPII